MKTFTSAAPIVVMMALLSSCSCLIRFEEWSLPANSTGMAISDLESSAITCGFKSHDGEMKKRDYYLRIDADRNKVALRSFWCPYPHRLLSTRSSIDAWAERGNRIREEFLAETQRRNLLLEE